MNCDKITMQYLNAMKRFETNNVKNAITHDDIKNCFKKRPLDSYKGSCGRLLVCGGSTGLTGAAIMSCRSALRCGCGLITLACPKSLNTVFEIALTEAMTLPLDDVNGIITGHCKDDIISFSQKCDAVLYGPGLSRTEDLVKLTKNLITECSVPLVIDADGLNALSKDINVLKSASCPIIITPHVGEFSVLTQKSTDYILKNQDNMALEFATEFNVTVVLKSHQTCVASTDGRLFKNILGGPAMAKGGSGDVLSGAIASVTAHTGDVLGASLAGVYIHSLAADMAVQEFGEYSLIPGDIIEYIKYAVRETAYRA